MKALIPKSNLKLTGVMLAICLSTMFVAYSIIEPNFRFIPHIILWFAFCFSWGILWGNIQAFLILWRDRG